MRKNNLEEEREDGPSGKCTLRKERGAAIEAQKKKDSMRVCRALGSRIVLRGAREKKVPNKFCSLVGFSRTIMKLEPRKGNRV
jgi:hypothetical protein